ncbi:MAG: LTA synthase family protein [Muribaculaceae bacterium]|nr:LTA synthase family protein [Muribaculaceae bacterium]
MARLTIYFITATACQLLMAVLFTLNLDGFISVWMLTTCALEAALPASLVFVLPGRWKAVSPTVVGFMAVFFFANILFARFTNDMIPIGLVLHSASYNGEALGCVPSLLRLHDLPYLFMTAIAVAAYIVLGIGAITRPTKHRKSMAVIPLIILVSYVLWLAILCEKAAQPETEGYAARVAEGFAIKTGAKKIAHRRTNTSDFWLGCGFGLFTVSQYEFLNDGRQIDLTPEQRTQIADFMRTPATSAADSTFAANRHKNLIFIVVESLNAWTVGKHYDGRAITPVMDSLINLPGTISCLNVVPQVLYGESSDGQFMYNTGLLPLRRTSVALYFPSNTYHPQTLVSSLGYCVAEEFIAERPKIWNHYLTTGQYRYTKLHCDLYSRDKRTSDERVLTTAADSIAAMKQPFYTFITTISTHYNFTEKNMPHPAWISGLELDKLHIDYLCSIHNVDRLIGVFIERLRREGLLDDSVIVIASDHHVAVSDPAAPANQGGIEPIVFIALNTGRHEKIDRPVGQIDVYPTILEIMGRPAQSIGMSMLDTANASSVDGHGLLIGTSGDSIDARKRRAWDISELIIRGDYFGSTKD